MKRIYFMKEWQKLCANEFTTIRIDRGTLWYTVGDKFNVYVGGGSRDRRKNHLCAATLVDVKRMTIADLTEEIAENDIDPCEHPLQTLRETLYKFYSNNLGVKPFWKGDDTRILLLTFKKVR